MDNNNSRTSARSYTWTSPKLILVMTLLGLCLFALPFFLNAGLEPEGLSAGGYVLGFLVGIPLGLIALSIAKKYRKGITIDPQADQITFGKKTVALSSIESAESDLKIPWWSKVANTNQGGKLHSYVVLYGPFGSWRIRTRSLDQASAIVSFLKSL